MKRKALMVGINSYPYLGENSSPGSFKHLNHPAQDAQAIAESLKREDNKLNWDIEYLPEKYENQIFKVNPHDVVTKNELEEAIVQLFNPISGSNLDVALLFFSGHGLYKKRSDGKIEGFLATSDTYGVPGKDNWGVSLNWLREQLKKSRVKQQIVWLNCCYSGLFIPKDASEFNDGISRCLIVASGGDCKAFAVDERGVMTNVLIEALIPNQEQDSINTNTVTNFFQKELENQNNQVLRRQSPPPPVNIGPPIELWYPGPTIKQMLRELEDLLTQKMWKQADRKTSELIFKAAMKDKGDYLQEGDIKKIDCNVLLEIDRLWLTQNDGDFGFSTQKDIWKEVCEQFNSQDFNSHDFNSQNLNSDLMVEEFGRKVKWFPRPTHNDWKLRNAITSDLTRIKGYLPTPPCSDNSNRISSSDVWLTKAIVDKLTQCELTKCELTQSERESELR